MSSLTGRTVAITGAAGAIAQSLSGQLYAAGANLILGDLDREALDRQWSGLDPRGLRTRTETLDVTSRVSNEDFVAAAEERFGGIDHLVLAAGIYPEHSIGKVTDDQWRRTMEVNLDAAMYMIRASLPALRAGGSIVAVSSIAAHRGSKNHSAYAASKGALLSLTRSLAWELAPHIRVNAVSPGVIETAMTVDLVSDQGERILSNTPLGRFGKPEEAASAIGFLCSDAASFITGEVLHVNGGHYMA
ncbi:SDR family NAD(P)-dependent oxidoreductase [Paenarthrobacter nicotinovorans]|uniref:SDR family NAD(P)-dependent oxidoreductase n=1 Tax=Paenarthrobacter nicotinovorans TaxID=29320 RepID=UPI0038092822